MAMWERRDCKASSNALESMQQQQPQLSISNPQYPNPSLPPQASNPEDQSASPGFFPEAQSLAGVEDQAMAMVGMELDGPEDVAEVSAKAEPSDVGHGDMGELGLVGAVSVYEKWGKSFRDERHEEEEEEEEDEEEEEEEDEEDVMVARNEGNEYMEGWTEGEEGVMGFEGDLRTVDESDEVPTVDQAGNGSNVYSNLEQGEAGVLEDGAIGGEVVGNAETEEDGLQCEKGVEANEFDNASEDTIEEQAAFYREIEGFFRERNKDFKPPRFYKTELDCFKLWKAVVKLGGYEQVTANKLWRQVGESFEPPKTCTTVSWSFRGFYEKALLEFERYKLGLPSSATVQGQLPVSEANDNQDGASPNTSGQQGVSASGRARRDAAARAMQGWHAQRGEVGDPIIKDKSSSKREKRMRNAAMLRKREATNKVGRPYYKDDGLGGTTKSQAAIAFHKRKAAKFDNMKPSIRAGKHDFRNGIDPLIVDEGPQADWVKINVHKTRDCFEVYALVPGLLREEVRIQCEAGGRLVIAGEPEQPDNPWGVTAFRKVINLPMRIDAHQTSAVVTLHGQLFVRVPFAQDLLS